MNDDSKIATTISEFLEQTGARISFFDMGRRVIEIPRDDILAFEQAHLSYPQPFQQSAWLGILFYYENETNNNETHNIWFLKFPLDERGLLQQAARDDFLRQTFKMLGESLTQPISNQTSNNDSDDNPHGFTPREDRMASFHAKIAKQLGLTPSQHYKHATEYFSGKLSADDYSTDKNGFDQWNFVGLQGIADVASRLDEDTNEANVILAIPQLPATPFAALCGCLENENISTELSKALANRIEKALIEDDATIVAAGLRGLSYSQDNNIVAQVLQSTLSKPTGKHVEVLAAIAGRAWQFLDEAATCQLFLESLSRCEVGQGAFDGILSDLLFMPTLRDKLLDSLRNPDRSEHLASAIGSFFRSVQTPKN